MNDGTLAAGGDAQVIADLARQAGTPHALDTGKPHVVVVEDHQHVKTVDLERFLPVPRRASGEYKPADVDSFVEYAKMHTDPIGTTVCIDETCSSVTAVLNDHGEGQTGWGDHRAVLHLKATDEWKHWRNADGTFMDQETFAAHIQDGIREITRPDSADMLEIAQTFQGETKANWQSGVRIDNGAVAFSYVEEISAMAGRTRELEIPQTFDLAVAPFQGEPTTAVVALLRWRIREGRLTIGYKLERPNDVVKAVLDGVAGKLKGEFGRVYFGVAPAAAE